MTSIATKTRERFLDVARQLFASNGVERTTMNDIAAASEKGRRTIYTYFKNKKEIYDAVIEREAEQIVSRLRKVAESSLEPTEKLRAYIMARFDIVEETVSSASSATSQFISYLTLDHSRLERIKRLAVEKEQHLFRTIIEKGVESGAFRHDISLLLPTVHQLIFQGVDSCHVSGGFTEMGVNPDEMRNEVADFIINSISVPRQSIK